MKVKRLIIFLVILSLVTASAWGVNSRSGKGSSPQTSLILDRSTFLWVNSILSMVYNHGNFGYDVGGLLHKTDGFYFPFASNLDTKTVIYDAGIWVGALVDGETRVAIAEYSTEFVPGPMRDGTSQSDRGDFRVYKIGDGTNLDGSPYADRRDREEWPYDQGAPYDLVDDSEGGLAQVPRKLGNQMCWAVYNDANEAEHVAMETKPLGVEIQQSTFGFSMKGPLDNVIFLKYIIYNRGENFLEDMYISLWADPDVGNLSDDLVGCDTTLSLGYAYNSGSDDIYGNSAPAVGIDFFQGPIVESPGDVAVLPDTTLEGYKVLGMTSFNKYINGTDPRNAFQTYNYMKGLFPDGSPVIDEQTGLVTKYQVPGDPVNFEGWTDATPADRRFMMSTGPFDMAVGDSQIVVAAVLVAQGDDPLDAITELKEIDRFAQVVYNLNFDIPQPPPTPQVHARGFDNRIELVWLPNAEGPENYLEDYRTKLGQLFIFEGYNVYAGETSSGPWTKVATFDYTPEQSHDSYAGTVGEDADCIWFSLAEEWDCSVAETMRIWDFELLYEDKAKQRVLSQTGANSGTAYGYTFDRDPIDGSSIIPNRPYYFAVTAYAVNIQQIFPDDSVFLGPNFQGMLSANLESKPQAITVIPLGSSATLERDGDRISGASDGYVEIEYLVQDSLTGHDYEVTFNEDLSWNLVDLTINDTVLARQSNLSGDFSYPIVNGMMVRVVGPDPGFKDATVAYAEETSILLYGHEAYLGGRNVVNNSNFRDFVIKFLAGPGDTVPGPVFVVETEEENPPGDPIITVDSFPTVRYLDGNGDTIWAYFYGEGVYGNLNSREAEEYTKVSVPFAVYDLGDDFDGQGDDVRLWPMLYDFYGLGRWFLDDYIVLMSRDVGGTDANIYGEDFFSYAPHDGDPSYYVWSDDVPPEMRLDWDYRAFGWSPDGEASGWAKGDSLVFVSAKANIPDDVFRFSAPRVGDGDGTFIKKTMANIKTVPNPYYNYWNYEKDQFGRIVKFLNLPPGVEITIRIFNLAGDLVRTLVHPAGDNAEETWDLKTESGLHVASGIYIWLAESEIGEKFGKMALFTEVEQLNVY